MAAKVQDAATVTTTVQTHLDRALELLETHARVNASGVLKYPSWRRAALLAAAAQITAAAELIGATNWPTAREYEDA
jgi:hypothetical protein